MIFNIYSTFNNTYLMKNALLFCCFVSLLISCKPTIYNVIQSPEPFCDCENGRLDYQLKDAESFDVSFSPAEAVSEVRQETSPFGVQIVYFRICQSTTATIIATNKNGTTTKSVDFHRTSEPSTISGNLTPYCLGSRFEGWSYVPTYNLGEPSPYPVNGVLNSIVIVVDRPGVFQYRDRNINVSAGSNLINDFNNMSPNGGNYSFIAPLTPTEQCVETGTVLPAGRRPPPNFSITLNVRCP